MTKTAYVKQIANNGVTFAGRTNSNHWVVMDGPEKFGGSDAGVRPKELLLLSIAGCTGSDVASILAKKRVNLRDFEINVSAEESEEHPIVFTKLHIEYVLYGSDIQEKDVERAIDLSQTKYCGVTAMFEKAMEVTHSYRIEE
ncbi:OsmC family protein [bacterium]|nr:OsmC family protein [bacterium]